MAPTPRGSGEKKTGSKDPEVLGISQGASTGFRARSLVRQLTGSLGWHAGAERDAGLGTAGDALFTLKIPVARPYCFVNKEVLEPQTWELGSPSRETPGPACPWPVPTEAQAVHRIRAGAFPRHRLTGHENEPLAFAD